LLAIVTPPITIGIIIILIKSVFIKNRHEIRDIRQKR
jgi:hypothetical protein